MLDVPLQIQAFNYCHVFIITALILGFDSLDLIGPQ